MQLIIMRHGPAEDTAKTGRDVDRRLSAEGRLVLQETASLLLQYQKLDPFFALKGILTSPAIRARETAEIIGQELDLPIEECTDLAPHADLPLSLVQHLLRERTHLLLVGHQPIVEQLVVTLTQEFIPHPGFRTGVGVQIVYTDQWHIGRIFDPRNTRSSHSLYIK